MRVSSVWGCGDFLAGSDSGLVGLSTEARDASVFFSLESIN